MCGGVASAPTPFVYTLITRKSSIRLLHCVLIYGTCNSTTFETIEPILINYYPNSWYQIVIITRDNSPESVRSNDIYKKYIYVPAFFYFFQPNSVSTRQIIIIFMSAAQ